MYLPSCSALTSGHFPVLVDTACRSPFHQPPHRPEFRRTDWANFETLSKILFHSIRNCKPRWQSTRALRTLPAPFWRIWRHLIPSFTAWRPRPPIPAGIQDEIVWRAGCEGGGRSPGTRSENQGQPPANVCDPLASGETAIEVRHSNLSIPKTSRCGGWPNGRYEFLLHLPSGHPGGNGFSDSEKAEALADNLETQI